MSQTAFVDHHLFFFRGRVGLYAILRAMGVGPGDEVVLQAFTCVAVPEAILALGAKPVWADIVPRAVNAGVDEFSAKISGRTKAVIVQHTFGIPANVERLAELCVSRNVPLIEDCCHVGRSTVSGRALGTFGIGSFWSYEWGKPIIAGVGGSAFVADEALRRVLEGLYHEKFHLPSTQIEQRLALQRRVHSMLYTPRTFWTVRGLFRLFSKLGLVTGNYNPIDQTNLAPDYRWRAARGTVDVLRRAVECYEESLTRLRAIMHRYRNELCSPSVFMIEFPDTFDGVLARFPLLVERKAELLERARANKLEIAGWYQSAVHPLKAPEELQLVSYTKGSCPNAESAAQQIVSLPIGLKCSDEYVGKVIRLINTY